MICLTKAYTRTAKSGAAFTTLQPHRFWQPVIPGVSLSGPEMNMTKTFALVVCMAALMLGFNSACSADGVFRVRMYFGLSIPGGGAISLEAWESFQQYEIAKVFDGFNVVDSVGYYKGKPERSKIVTVIVEEKDTHKVRALAALYSKRFRQDSVMVVKVPVSEWRFIGAEENSKANR